MKRLLIVASILLLPVLYGVDDGILQFRISRNLAPYDTITVQTYYVIPHKDGKAEFIYADPDTESCVRALFPQVGKRPCWYARRHSTKEIAP